MLQMKYDRGRQGYAIVGVGGYEFKFIPDTAMCTIDCLIAEGHKMGSTDFEIMDNAHVRKLLEPFGEYEPLDIDFTMDSPTESVSFEKTGHYFRGGVIPGLPDLCYGLDRDVIPTDLVPHVRSNPDLPGIPFMLDLIPIPIFPAFSMDQFLVDRAKRINDARRKTRTAAAEASRQAEASMSDNTLGRSY